MMNDTMHYVDAIYEIRKEQVLHVELLSSLQWDCRTGVMLFAVLSENRATLHFHRFPAGALRLVRKNPQTVRRKEERPKRRWQGDRRWECN